MFFYLSFLRQPPHVSNLSTPILITPQIANDLRTSYLNESPDIFYIWVSSLSDCIGPAASSSARKLTVWRTSSMYKPLSLKPPAMARPGQYWRLSLSSGNSKPRFVISLNAENFGQEPLPVISMPMLLDAKAKLKGQEKQEQVERLYSVLSGQNEAILCIREQTSFDLDKVTIGPK